MRNRGVLRLVFVAMLALLASKANAQSYGPEEQVLTIGAAEFRSWLPYGGYIDSDGYLYDTGSHQYLALVSLPEGASIEKLCLYANDADPGDFKFVDAFIVAVKLVPGGEDAVLDSVAQGTYSSSNVGYGYYCSEPFAYTLRGKTDIDEDGIPDAVAYYVWADVPVATQNSLGLGGVRITWKRQVSAPPATATFGDVPASDPAFPHVEALAASGITAGCAGGNFCPDANLTRRQMAVFLAKALGLHWSD